MILAVPGIFRALRLKTRILNQHGLHGKGVARFPCHRLKHKVKNIFLIFSQGKGLNIRLRQRRLVRKCHAVRLGNAVHQQDQALLDGVFALSPMSINGTWMASPV